MNAKQQISFQKVIRMSTFKHSNLRRNSWNSLIANSVSFNLKRGFGIYRV